MSIGMLIGSNSELGVDNASQSDLLERAVRRFGALSSVFLIFDLLAHIFEMHVNCYSC
jgi:hypothetical protein